MSGTYRFLLRMPPALRAHLQEAIAENGRSLNQEVVRRLERSLDESDQQERRGRWQRPSSTALWVGAATIVVALAAWAATRVFL
jgi:hypothetical protein